MRLEMSHSEELTQLKELEESRWKKLEDMLREVKVRRRGNNHKTEKRSELDSSACAYVVNCSSLDVQTSNSA